MLEFVLFSGLQPYLEQGNIRDVQSFNFTSALVPEETQLEVTVPTVEALRIFPLETIDTYPYTVFVGVENVDSQEIIWAGAITKISHNISKETSTLTFVCPVSTTKKAVLIDMSDISGERNYTETGTTEVEYIIRGNSPKEIVQQMFQNFNTVFYIENDDFTPGNSTIYSYYAFKLQLLHDVIAQYVDNENVPPMYIHYATEHWGGDPTQPRRLIIMADECDYTHWVLKQSDIISITQFSIDGTETATAAFLNNEYDNNGSLKILTAWHMPQGYPSDIETPHIQALITDHQTVNKPTTALAYCDERISKTPEKNIHLTVKYNPNVSVGNIVTFELLLGGNVFYTHGIVSKINYSDFETMGLELSACVINDNASPNVQELKRATVQSKTVANAIRRVTRKANTLSAPSIRYS